LATTTRVDRKPEIASIRDEYEDAYEVVDGVPIDRPSIDPVQVAYEEAYEIVNGQPIEEPEMGVYPNQVASILHEYLGPFVRRQGLGRSTVETKFRTRPTNKRRPDVAFISFAKWPKGRRAPDTDAWDFVPDLAVEVISKSDKAWDVLGKVREYFDAGVEAVWLIYPNLELIHVYTSFLRIEVLTREQTLDGGTVVPGFRLALADLFEGEAEPEAEPAEPTEPAPPA